MVPLRLDIPMLQGIMEYSKRGQLVIITPFTLAGAMAPVTLAGALSLQNAEALSGMVFSQLVRPGAPVAYGGFTSNVDMQSGAPAFGTPEYMRTAMAGGQLARRYGVPYRSSNVCAANALDAQAAYESVFSLWGAIQGGVNFLMHGAGWTYGQPLDALDERRVGQRAVRTPFVIGIAGSVAVGKSTVSRLLRELLSRWSTTPRVELITTDGFLYPNAELEARGIMHRKGFPESYDRLALLKFVADVKSGVEEVSAPVYSHLFYDIMPDQSAVVRSPDVLIVEGLNVLQPPAQGQEVALSDYFDFQIYVDAETHDVTQWFLDRFRKLRESAFTNPNSYFHRYSEMEYDQALARANEIWSTINLPNLTENILPTRSRATLVLKKGANHAVQSVLLRKI